MFLYQFLHRRCHQSSLVAVAAASLNVTGDRFQEGIVFHREVFHKGGNMEYRCWMRAQALISRWEVFLRIRNICDNVGDGRYAEYLTK